MSRIHTICGVGALALGLAACSDFTSAGDPLSDAEAAELAAVVAEEGFPGFGGAASPAFEAPEANDGADGRITITISDSGPCEGGGTASFAGSLTADVNDQAGTGTFEFEFTLTPNACLVTTESNKVFKITGDPDIEGSGKLNFSETHFDGSLSYKGKFKWEEGTRSGTCGINLEVSYNFTSSGTTISGTGSVNGEVCGVTVNRTITLQDVG